MRVGLYGGSFNPPHVGHAMVASWALWTDQVDEVWLMPTASHPFGKSLADFHERVRLCEGLAAALGSNVRVETIEHDLPRPNYTFNTLEALHERHPGVQFRPVLGSDQLLSCSRWHRWIEMKTQYPPLWVGRTGYPAVEGAPSFPAVSSTEIRTRISRGHSIRDLVLAEQREAIEALYRPKAQKTAGPPITLP